MTSKSTKAGIIVAILLLAVGFAAVTTTLYINGTVVIKPDNQNFIDNLLFASAELDADAVAAGAEIIDGGANSDHITFKTQDFSLIGDSATLTYTIKNDSQYGAELSAITCNAIAESDGGSSTNVSDYATYLSVEYGGEITDAVGTTVEKGGTSNPATVKVSMSRSYVGDNAKTITYKCVINANATEA